MSVESDTLEEQLRDLVDRYTTEAGLEEYEACEVAVEALEGASIGYGLRLAEMDEEIDEEDSKLDCEFCEDLFPQCLFRIDYGRTRSSAKPSERGVPPTPGGNRSG